MFVSSFIARGSLVVAVSVCVIAASSCSSSPTSPDPVAQNPTPTQPGPTPAPTPTPTPTPSPVGAVTISVNPNPVPHSGVPVADVAGCRNVPYTWYYDQVFQETGGSTVTFTQRIDLFDERETNNISNLNIVVSANGTNSIRSRWCTSAKIQHSAQTRWIGTDAAGRSISVLGPRVILTAPQ